MVLPFRRGAGVVGRMGRRPRGQEPLTTHISLRLTRSQYRRLGLLAYHADTSPGTYLRQLLEDRAQREKGLLKLEEMFREDQAS